MSIRGLRVMASVSSKKWRRKMVGVHKTKGDFCRFQLATNSIEKGSLFMRSSACIIEKLSKSVATTKVARNPLCQELHEEL